MANYSKVKESITADIKTNGNQEITGQLMQDNLIRIVNAVSPGDLFVGFATPTTLVANFDANVFYIASVKGVYPNFGGLSVENEMCVFSNRSGVWQKTSIGVATKAEIDLIIAELGEAADAAITEASIAATTANSSAVNADNKAALAVTATANANTATTNANTAATNANNAATNANAKATLANTAATNATNAANYTKGVGDSYEARMVQLEQVSGDLLNGFKNIIPYTNSGIKQGDKVISDANYNYTDYVPVEIGDIITVTAQSNDARLNSYDVNKKFIRTLIVKGVNDIPVTVKISDSDIRYVIGMGVNSKHPDYINDPLMEVTRNSGVTSTLNYTINTYVGMKENLTVDIKDNSISIANLLEIILSSGVKVTLNNLSTGDPIKYKGLATNGHSRSFLYINMSLLYSKIKSALTSSEFEFDGSDILIHSTNIPTNCIMIGMWYGELLTYVCNHKSLIKSIHDEIAANKSISDKQYVSDFVPIFPSFSSSVKIDNNTNIMSFTDLVIIDADSNSSISITGEVSLFVGAVGVDVTNCTDPTTVVFVTYDVIDKQLRSENKSYINTKSRRLICMVRRNTYSLTVKPGEIYKVYASCDLLEGANKSKSLAICTRDYLDEQTSTFEIDPVTDLLTIDKIMIYDSIKNVNVGIVNKKVFLYKGAVEEDKSACTDPTTAVFVTYDSDDKKIRCEGSGWDKNTTRLLIAAVSRTRYSLTPANHTKYQVTSTLRLDSELITAEGGIKEIHKESLENVYASLQVWGWTYTDNKFRILHFSDNHVDLRTKYHDTNIKELYDIANLTNANIAIHTGDFLSNNNGPRDNKSNVGYFYSLIKQYNTNNVKTMHCIGNHDNNFNNDVMPDNPNYANLISNKYLYDNITSKLAADYGYSATFNNDHNYGYYDDVTNKIRVISINQVDSVNNAELQECYRYFWIGQAQWDWIYTTLLNTPADYGVMIAMHTQIESHNCDMITDVINAWVNGTSYTMDYTDILNSIFNTNKVFDFTSRGKGEFISYMVGHVHGAYIYKHNRFDQLIICAANNNTQYSRIVYRSELDSTHAAFNYIAVDRKRKTIWVTFIGAYKDMYGVCRKRDYVVNYTDCTGDYLHPYDRVR